MDDSFFQNNNQNSIYVLNCGSAYGDYVPHGATYHRYCTSTTGGGGSGRGSGSSVLQRKLENVGTFKDLSGKMNRNVIISPSASSKSTSTTTVCSPAAAAIQKLFNCSSIGHNNSDYAGSSFCNFGPRNGERDCNHSPQAEASPGALKFGTSSSSGSRKKCFNVKSNLTAKKAKFWQYLEGEKWRIGDNRNNAKDPAVHHGQQEKRWSSDNVSLSTPPALLLSSSLSSLSPASLPTAPSDVSDKSASENRTFDFHSALLPPTPCGTAFKQHHTNNNKTSPSSLSSSSSSSLSSSSSSPSSSLARATTISANVQLLQQQQQQQQQQQLQPKANNWGGGGESIRRNQLQQEQPKLSKLPLQCQRKSSRELYQEAVELWGLSCTLCDNCRCIDCQSAYFDCDDSDSWSELSFTDEYDEIEDSTTALLLHTLTTRDGEGGPAANAYCSDMATRCCGPLPHVNCPNVNCSLSDSNNCDNRNRHQGLDGTSPNGHTFNVGQQEKRSEGMMSGHDAAAQVSLTTVEHNNETDANGPSTRQQHRAEFSAELENCVSLRGLSLGDTEVGTEDDSLSCGCQGSQ